MAVRIVVKGDIVAGTDQHQVLGNVGSNPPENRKFSYSFSGEVEEKNGGNDFVRIQDKIVISHGNNQCPQLSNHVAILPTNPDSSFTITKFDPDEPDNNGENSQGAGSNFVTIFRAPVILDGDDFDTCDFKEGSNEKRSQNSTVKSSMQDFVTISEMNQSEQEAN